MLHAICDVLCSDSDYSRRPETADLNISIYRINPLNDSRWADLVERHSQASAFHTVTWLQALRQTYGYEPIVFTTSPPTTELKNGLVFCHVRSWLTGSRLVSLPFSDHCQPLCESTEELDFLIRYLRAALGHQNWKYLELRPINGNFAQTNQTNGFLPTANYLLHVLDISPDLDKLFRSFDKDSVQRRIRRAERADLIEKCGSSDDLLKDFYNLFVLTRNRHGLPPTPFTWFQNLVRCQGKALQIRLAYKDKTPISAILTLRFKDVLYYKYGCSDSRFNNLGATSWLFWRAIVEAKSNGATKFDLGRTEEDNAGLIAFKNHWVRQPERIVYWKYSESTSHDSVNGWKLRMAKRLFSFMPNRVLKIAGNLLYRHIA